MKWQDGRRSQNVEDRRASGGRAMPMKAGMGGIGLVVVVVMLLMGKDPRALLSMLGQTGGGTSVSLPGGGADTSGPVQETPEEQKLSDFVKVVLADTEDVWNKQFQALGRQYEEPVLVLFRGAVQSACGHANAAMGPFYCPADHKAYIDLSFYDDLRKRHQAPGDFAQAYVIAHEIGHHVQNLLGISDKLHQMRGKVSEEEYNRASVRLELQADFFAGLWAHHAHRNRQILETGDVEEALTAATAIGDDRLQKEGQGYVVPDSFTHGTSAQRVRWFKKGLQTGDFKQSDTFAVPYESL
jgi:predicted metalloprotease